MGKIISLTGCKGGCGTTTLTAALGFELAAMEKKVCLLDGHAGMRALDIMLRAQDKAVFDFFDLCKDICSAEQALIQIAPSLSMIAAPQLDIEDEMNLDDMRHLFQRLAKRFDYTLIDMPDPCLQICKAMRAIADENILIATPGDISLRNMERLCALIRENESSPISCIINCKDMNAKLNERLQAQIDYLDIRLIGAIPFYEAVFMETLDRREYNAYPGKIKAAVRDTAKRLDSGEGALNLHRSRRLPWHS
ncbi:MAG: AAA family ATPase [Clostridia bacterium]|nr:AAA family ATPase [Clostridia bacterium]